jgi:hypothetical protein
MSIGQRDRLGNGIDQFHDGDVLQYDHLLGCLLSGHVIQWLAHGIAVEELSQPLEHAMLCRRRYQRVRLCLASGQSNQPNVQLDTCSIGQLHSIELFHRRVLLVR